MWNYVILSIALIGLCSACLTNCNECNSSNNRCSVCKSGYYLVKNTGECMNCRSPCLECTSSTSCTWCASGYYLDNFSCNECKRTCSTCSNTTGHCITCPLKSYLQAGICIPCDRYCISCSNTSANCDKCEPNYYGPSCSHVCLGPCKGVECDKNSGECIDGCIVGYYKAETVCYRCPNNCTACQNGSKCTECESEHYLNTNDDGHSMCSPCEGRCPICEQSHCRPNDATNSTTTQTSVSQTTTEHQTITSETSLSYAKRSSQTSTTSSKVETSTTQSDQTTSATKTTETQNTTTMEGTDNPTNSKNEMVTEPRGPTDTTSIIGGSVGGAGTIAVFIVIIVVVVWTRRRKTFLNGDTNESYLNSVVYGHSSHSTEHEAGPLYSTPNKVKKVIATQSHSAVNYENASVGPGPPPNITAYLDDDLMEETDRSESDSTGGRVEGVYDTYYNTGELFRRHVTVDSLAEVVSKKALSDYEEEFKKFPDGLARNYEEALKKENAKNNRYKKVYPYDATRVVLKDGGDGDYINASYISAPRGDMTYIAALGPTAAHSEGFSLFWRMVWQENVDKIVVLTKLNEENKMKFERYWPPQGRPEIYGRVEVQTVTEENCSEYTIRRFSVSRSSEQRTVFQAHYTAWPDRSVPDNLASLLDFRHKVKALPSKRIGPVVVHCSAGIGRTGTYIALDLLIHEGQSSGLPDGIWQPSVDVYGCVSALRGQRVNMVQNVEQYRYLHHALVYALTVDTGPIPNCELLTCLSDDGKSRLAHQFKMLQRVLVLRGEDMTLVNKKKNAHKNRPGADIPGVKHRPSLLYQGKSGDTDYINAVYLDGHVDCRKFLVTQTPLEATVKDFLRLVFQEHVHTIVSMDPQHVTDKHDVGLYVPGYNQELKVGSFTVRCTKCETKPYFILRELNIQNKTGKGTDETKLHQFHFTGWLPGAMVPISAETLIQTIREVERIAGQEREPGPIIVHCLTGAERSGLFCTVSLLMEKVINDQVVSVVNTVSQVRDRRSMAIPTVDQYIFCHECIAVSSQSAEYTNVAGTASCDILLTSQSAEYTNVAGTASHDVSLTSQSAEYTNVAGTASCDIILTSQSAEYTNVAGTSSDI